MGAKKQMNWINNIVKRNSQPSILNCTVYDGDLFEVYSNTAQYPTVETGGDLFGVFTEDGNVMISRIIGPGPKSSHLVTHFTQDADFLLNEKERLQGHNLKRIGSWHSHHKLSGQEPTASDCEEVSFLMESQQLDKFVQMITYTDDHTQKVSAKAYLFQRGSKDFVPLTLNILTGLSPFSFAEQQKSEEL